MADLRPLVDDPIQVPDDDTVLRILQPAFQRGDAFQSNGFQDQSLEVAAGFGLAGKCASVSLRSIWEAAGGDLDGLLRDFPPGSAVAEIAVRDLRNLVSLGGDTIPQGLMLHPAPGAPWHGVIFGTAESVGTKATNRARAAVARWFWRPDQAPESGVAVIT